MISDAEFKAVLDRVLVLEAMLLASTEITAVEPPAEGKHHWAAVLDHGGQVPVFMPVDARAKPIRMVATTRGSELVLHFQCSRCGERGLRRFAARVKIESPHRAHYDFPEVESLSDGPCAHRPAERKPAGLLTRLVAHFWGEPAQAKMEATS